MKKILALLIALLLMCMPAHAAVFKGLPAGDYLVQPSGNASAQSASATVWSGATRVAQYTSGEIIHLEDGQYVTTTYAEIVAANGETMKSTTPKDTTSKERLAEIEAAHNVIYITPNPTATPAPEWNSYEADIYKVGKDIPAGRYMIVAEYIDNGYYCISADANANDIINNEGNFTLVYIEVFDGEYLDLRRCIAYEYREYDCALFAMLIRKDHPNASISRVCNGIDLKANEYKVTRNDDANNGYWSLTDWRGNLYDNNGFEKSAYINVLDGQILNLHRCHIVE